jgi:hypothetical protein
MEIWKDIVGYEGLYQVSNLGRVKSLPKMCGRSFREERLLTVDLSNCGYNRVSLCKDNKLTKYGVHRLVATAFIENPCNLPQVNHLDGNKTNNNVCNLEWCTAKDNTNHAFNNGLRATGETHWKSKLTEKDVAWIREHYLKGDRIYGSKALGRKFNVKDSTILCVVNGITWRDVI